jgi:Zn-finger nucleic acid-binding protein
MAHQDAKCPACGVRLVDRTAGGVAVRFCEACDGICVDAPTFEELSAAIS